MAPSISFPPAAAIEILDGSNWPTWSSRILALLRMNGLRSHVTEDKPAAPPSDWSTTEDMLLGVLEMYSQKDVWTTVSDDTKFATCKLKWEELKRVYGGVGSMSAFNTWVSLTGTALEDSQPMLPQLQKLNDARMTLKNNDMPISDLQFCFILIKALPDSYSAVASTILATGAPSALSPQTIQERILNEEGRRSGSSASLNKVAPVKRTTNVTCSYCKKPGHKSNECRKKKRDAKANDTDKEEEKDSSAQTPARVVNAHVVPTASITEVPDSDSDNDIRVSLYAAVRSQWLVDSGATHHNSPIHPDSATRSPIEGSVSLGGHAEYRSNRLGTGHRQAERRNWGVQLTLQDVMHVPTENVTEPRSAFDRDDTYRV